MLQIIICDEDNTYCKELHHMIRFVLFEKIEYCITCYNSGTELLKLLENEKLDAKLIFFNIGQKNQDGLNTAHLLREHNADVDIIFTSSNYKCALQGYEVHAYDFLMKPISTKRLETVLFRYYQECVLDKKNYLLVNNRTEQKWLCIRNIHYFMSDKRKIITIQTAPHAPAEFYMKMEDLENKMLPKGFCRCHQSYLVNVRHILSLDQKSITLINNEKIPVSRKYKNNVLNILKKMSI